MPKATSTSRARHPARRAEPSNPVGPAGDAPRTIRTADDREVDLPSDLGEGPEEQLYVKLVAATKRSQKRESLANLRAALRSMRSRGIRTFSLAAAARAVKQLGHKAPALSTIQNDGGEDFQALISAYAKQYGAPAKPREESRDDELVASITDLRTRAQVLWLLNENRGLQNANNALHALIQRLKPVSVLPDGSFSDAPRPALAPGGGTHFTDQERAAVQEFLGNLAEFEAELDASGALMLPNGNEIARPGFAQALRKVVGD